MPVAVAHEPFARHRAVFATQFGHGCREHVICARRQLGLEVVGERTRLDLDRIDQVTPRVRGGDAADPPLGHPQVHQARTEPVLVDPRRRRRVVFLRHEQRQREPAQHALGGAPPLGVVVAHVEQLARERQRVGGEAERGAQLAAHSVQVAPDVAAAVLQPVDLVLRGLARTAQVGALLEQRIAPVFQRHSALLEPAAHQGRLLRPGEEVRGILGRGELRTLEQRVVAAPAVGARAALCLRPRDLGVEFLQPVAADAGALEL